MRSILFLVLTMATALFPGCGGGGGSVPPAPGDPCSVLGIQPKIINGVACSGFENSAIVRVAVVIKRAEVNYAIPVCTGAMIDRRFVLTATHCLNDAEIDGFKIRGRGILVGPAGDLRFLPAIRTNFAPGYILDNERLFNDLAIVELEDDSGLPILPLLASATPAVEDEVFVYGYGQRIEGDAPEKDVFAELQAGTMVLDSVTPNHFFVNFSGSGTNVCFGDSGGPMLYPGQNAVIGVVSQGSKSGCKAGDVTTFTNVISEEHLAWIQSIVPNVLLN